MPLPLTGVLLADARPQGSAQGGAQASPRPGARARGHQGPQAEPQGDAQLPQGGVRGPHQVQLLVICGEVVSTCPAQRTSLKEFYGQLRHLLNTG